MGNESVGHFFIADTVENVDEFINLRAHREILRAMADPPNVASGIYLSGVYVEYRPNIKGFARVVSLEQLQEQQ